MTEAKIKENKDPEFFPAERPEIEAALAGSHYCPHLIAPQGKKKLGKSGSARPGLYAPIVRPHCTNKTGPKEMLLRRQLENERPGLLLLLSSYLVPRVEFYPVASRRQAIVVLFFEGPSRSTRKIKWNKREK